MALTYVSQQKHGDFVSFIPSPTASIPSETKYFSFPRCSDGSLSLQLSGNLLVNVGHVPRGLKDSPSRFSWLHPKLDSKLTCLGHLSVEDDLGILGIAPFSPHKFHREHAGHRAVRHVAPSGFDRICTNTSGDKSSGRGINSGPAPDELDTPGFQ